MLLNHTEQHLFLACEHQQADVVQYLLTTHHINPNAKDDHQRTPLSLAKNKDIIKLLIQHGADAENVYALHRKVLNNVFSKDPIKNPVKMFVIGHGGEGKSTLIEAMEHEPTAWTSLVNVFITPKEVEGVDQRTAGIIPRVFNSRYYGLVLFYDFAGQEAYYSSHAAVIKSVVDTCPPVFLLVIKLNKDDAAITHSVFYWLGIITNQCANMEGKAQLIVVGSHADLMETSESDHRKLIISQAVGKYTSFDLVDVILMDCRYSNSNEMKILRQCVGTACNSLRSKLSISLNSHMFLIYLIEKHSSELAFTLENVQTTLKKEIDQKQLKKHKDVVPFIPTTIPRLVEICVQLNDKGHILFLLNKTSPEKSFVIIDKTKLLAEINGTMFAPEDFKQHCKLASSTGVVPRSKLAEQFQKFDTEMLIQFLSHLELAVAIEDPKVLELINQHLLKEGKSATLEKGYLFCPALVRLEVPPNVFKHENDREYHFGWMLSCIHAESFFDARFIHILILRLALSLGLAPVIDPDIPAFQHHCFVWKTGVCWSTPDGIKILVDVVNKKNVIVLVQAHHVSLELLTEQNIVIRKVVNTAKDYFKSVITEEFLLSPSDVIYPFKEHPQRALFSIKSVAESIVKLKPFVVSADATENIAVGDLLPAEVYSNLGIEILLPLFRESDFVCKTSMSDHFLSILNFSWSKNPAIDRIVCLALNRTTYHNCEETLYSILKCWRDQKQSDSDVDKDVTHGSYKSLRLVLNQISVFADRNPLVS